MLDARKKEVFAALYRWGSSEGLQKITPYLALSPHELLTRIKEKVVFLGDGSQVYRPLIEERLGALAVFAPYHLTHLRAATVAFFGLEEVKQGRGGDTSRLIPIYVRPSDAELKEMT